MSQFLPAISARLFDQDLMVRLALVLLHFLWQGSLCGLAALIAGRLMQNASSSARYRVLVGILCLMAVLPAVTYWRAKGGHADAFAGPACTQAVCRQRRRCRFSTRYGPASRGCGTRDGETHL